MELPTRGFAGKIATNMIRPRRKVRQGEFWVAPNDLAQAWVSRFYDKLDETLEAMDFDAKVHGICGRLYSTTR
jgi:hypothetical protein